MNFADPRMIVGMLFEGHKFATQSSPLVYYTIKNTKTLDKEKIQQLQLKENMNKFMKSCIDEFNSLNLAYGTAHYGAEFWIITALNAIYSQIDQDTINIPNGCCVIPSCSINKLYEIVYDKLV